MNKTQIAKANMYQRILLHYNDEANKAVYDRVDPLKELFDELIDENNHVIPYLQQQQNTGGVTENKNTLHNEAINLVMQLVRKSRPAAKKLGDDAFKAAMDVQATDFKGDELVSAAKLQSTLTEIANRKTLLVKYNVTDDLLADAQTSVTKFTNAIGTPQQAQATAKVATDNLPPLIYKIDGILEDITDLVIGNFATTHADVVKEFSC